MRVLRNESSVLGNKFIFSEVAEHVDTFGPAEVLGIVGIDLLGVGVED